MLIYPRDAFTGQSRSPNMVPFDMLGMVSYQSAIVTLRYSICDLETRVRAHRGHSRSSERTRIDPPPMTSD